MNEQKKLTFQMAIFFLVIFVIFGTIIIKEKGQIIFLPKIETSLNDYLKEQYNDADLIATTPTVEKNTYKMKVFNKTNKNHYFYITYSNKEITDSYQSDYVEGKTLLTHLNKVISKKINEITGSKYTISIPTTYDKFSPKIQSLLLSEENLVSLKLYVLETEITDTWNELNFTNSLTDTITTLEKESITPKSYTFILTNKDDLTQSVKIKNITSDLIKKNNLSTIISAIINKKETSILNENNITYEYLN